MDRSPRLLARLAPASSTHRQPSAGAPRAELAGIALLCGPRRWAGTDEISSTSGTAASKSDATMHDMREQPSRLRRVQDLQRQRLAIGTKNRRSRGRPDAIRKVPTASPSGAPAPLMEGWPSHGDVERGLTTSARGEYLPARDLCRPGQAGFHAWLPRERNTSGPFFRTLHAPAPEFATWLTIKGGIATVPGTSFFSTPEDGARQTRFAFCKTPELLHQAASRLAAL